MVTLFFRLLLLLAFQKCIPVVFMLFTKIRQKYIVNRTIMLNSFVTTLPELDFVAHCHAQMNTTNSASCTEKKALMNGISSCQVKKPIQLKALLCKSLNSSILLT